MKPLPGMKPMDPMTPMAPMKPLSPGHAWWPKELGDSPNSVGGQNEARYAFFGGKRRLAVDHGGGKVEVYDTGDHKITGVQQQQVSSAGTIQFTSQKGGVELKQLRRISPGSE